MINPPNSVLMPRGPRGHAAAKESRAPRRFGGRAVLAFLGFSTVAVVIAALVMLGLAWLFDALGVALW